jgi:hypothetical protein
MLKYITVKCNRYHAPRSGMQRFQLQQMPGWAPTLQLGLRLLRAHFLLKIKTPRALQVPRLTSVLRSLVSHNSPLGLLDPDAAYIQRQRQLADLQAAEGAGDSAHSKLSQQLLGPWSKGGHVVQHTELEILYHRAPDTTVYALPQHLMLHLSLYMHRYNESGHSSGRARR